MGRIAPGRAARHPHQPPGLVSRRRSPRCCSAARPRRRTSPQRSRRRLGQVVAIFKRGYLVENIEHPQTVGYAQADSPAGLAAWMLDHDPDSYAKIANAFLDGKLIRWTDAGERRRQRRALLADEHRRLGGAALLGTRPGASPPRSLRPGAPADESAGSLHGLPQRARPYRRRAGWSRSTPTSSTSARPKRVATSPPGKNRSSSLPRCARPSSRCARRHRAERVARATYAPPSADTPAKWRASVLGADPAIRQEASHALSWPPSGCPSSSAGRGGHARHSRARLPCLPLFNVHGGAISIILATKTMHAGSGAIMTTAAPKGTALPLRDVDELALVRVDALRRSPIWVERLAQSAPRPPGRRSNCGAARGLAARLVYFSNVTTAAVSRPSTAVLAINDLVSRFGRA